MTDFPVVPTAAYCHGRLAGALRKPLLALGALESRLLRREIEAIPLRAPVYIAGLARAGSTLLLEMLASHPEIATHRYRDFPYLPIPYLWNSALRFLPRRVELPRERHHGDGIQVTAESPEAMEEVLWMAFFPHLHDPALSNVLDAATHHPAFERFYRDHIRKILLIRGGTRYVAKGNYNVARLAYLHRLFPDARFLIPIREPLSHIASLLRQHARFLDYARRDVRTARMLGMTGHFEFGPDTRFLNVGAMPHSPAGSGPDVRSWAEYWNTLYGHVHHTLTADPTLAGRAMIVRFEALCAQPEATIRRILTFCDLEAAFLPHDWAARVRAPQGHAASLSDEEKQWILAITAPARAYFGYD